MPVTLLALFTTVAGGVATGTAERDRFGAVETERVERHVVYVSGIE